MNSERAIRKNSFAAEPSGDSCIFLTLLSLRTVSFFIFCAPSTPSLETFDSFTVCNLQLNLFSASGFVLFIGKAVPSTVAL